MKSLNKESLRFILRTAYQRVSSRNGILAGAFGLLIGLVSGVFWTFLVPMPAREIASWIFPTVYVVGLSLSGYILGVVGRQQIVVGALAGGFFFPTISTIFIGESMLTVWTFMLLGSSGFFGGAMAGCFYYTADRISRHNQLEPRRF